MRKTTLSHYCYDSFLFDFDKDEEGDLLPLIYDVFKEYNLNISEVRGKNYGEMLE
jgi:hypothetical protein